jgi:hypothetical protein
MTRKEICLVLLVLFGLVSCQQNKNVSTQTKKEKNAATPKPENTVNSPYLQSIEIVYPEFNKRVKREFSLDALRFGLIDDDFMAQPQFLVLYPATGWRGEFKIEQQSESTFSIPLEGPHVDLINWKHGYSEPQELMQDGLYKFNFAKYPDAPFPAYTRKDLDDAVRLEMQKSEQVETASNPAGFPPLQMLENFVARVLRLKPDTAKQQAALEHVLNEAMRCADQGENHCVGTSNRILTIKTLDNGKWVPVQKVFVEVAMGC